MGWWSEFKKWLSGADLPDHVVDADLPACRAATWEDVLMVTGLLTFRFNRRFYPMNAFRSLLGIASETTAPTYDALYSGKWQHPTCSGSVS